MLIIEKPLAGRVAFVTGASKGIGRAIAVGLAKAGAAVGLTGRTPGEGPGTAGETAAAIRASGGQALPLICDIRDPAAVEASIAATVAEFGRLDVLMNNAGLYFPRKTIAEIELALWDETITAHMTGTFLCARFAIPHLVAAGGGSIINMSSTGADPTHRAALNVAYSAAKAGVEQFTRGLAQELAESNIAANAIRPMKLLTESSHQHVLDRSQLSTYAQPESICPSIVWLAQCRREFTGNVVCRTDFEDGRFQRIKFPAPL
ncbi:SDR family NAD(P)-dependent oxidoreductase [Noviherbaspirillum sedimenti]|uniref:SDR family oxidoreductase n=1 Tax=Noviherbaspirillum sedimenti TaxID=2320865 RepID=A0A3A3G2E3_9BURK|nr:SDR family NAD(P)-dependent oxidoreductase [Noviherbaspirillum sedimenti]RJG00652.1 SDR family oxidoreductase [Noviherbaspirillum sedimenti]